MSRRLAFELGFDWNVPPTEGVRDGVFPLQVFLVDDGSRSVISSCNSSQIETTDVLSFRVYDFTLPDAAQADGSKGRAPFALQVLYTRAVVSIEGAPLPPFSPFEEDGEPVAQLATTLFAAPASQSSIAFGAGAVAGWDVEWPGGDSILKLPGRFKFRALLTVAAPGQVAKFYRVDPEMVIGDGGP